MWRLRDNGYVSDCRDTPAHAPVAQSVCGKLWATRNIEAKVVHMSQYESDPAANTDKFRAFVDDEGPGQARPAPSRSSARIVVPLVVAILVIAVVVWLLL